MNGITQTEFAHSLIAERDQLVRICAHISGNAEFAEDLAQETLLEAWRSLPTLHDPDHLAAWIAGIARNICLRWLRVQSQRKNHIAAISLDDIELADDANVDDALEQRDRAAFLNETLAQLPQDAQNRLLAYYVEELPLHDLAHRLNIQEAALAKRLQRDKLAFKRIVASDPEQRGQHYLATPLADIWENTGVWCPFCGRHTWQAQHKAGMVQYACPECHAQSLPEITTRDSWQAKGYKRMLWQMMTWVEQTYRPFLAATTRPCPRCGRNVPLERERFTLRMCCPWCHSVNENTLPLLTLGCAEGRGFWQGHPKLLLQPIQRNERDGRSAVTVTYTDTTSRAAFAASFAADTFELLATQAL